MPVKTYAGPVSQAWGRSLCLLYHIGYREIVAVVEPVPSIRLRLLVLAQVGEREAQP